MKLLRSGGAFAATAACFALVWAATPASATVVTGNSTTFTGAVTLSGQTNLSDIYFLYNGNGGAVTGAKSLGSNCIAGLGCITSVPFSYTDNSNYITSGYATALGIYNVGGTPTGIAVGVNSGTATSGVGQSFSSVFGGASESTVMGYLTGGDTTSLLAFLKDNSADFLQYTGDSTPITGGVLDFSNGTNGGSLTLTATALGTPPVSGAPEPASYLLLAAGAGVLALAKFRKHFSLLS